MLLGVVNIGTIAAVCAITAFISGGVTGMFFRSAAAAWKTERDAAVDKAERLESKVDEQAAVILALQARVADLEKKTDYEVYAERSARDHQAILIAVTEQTRQLHANTVAIEFLIKQAFPAASLAFPVTPEKRSTT